MENSKFLPLLLARKNADNAFVHDHPNDVKNPNNSKSENQTDKTSNNLAFHKASYETANPRSYRDDSQNQTNDPAQSKIVIFTCHIFLSFINIE